MSVIDKRGLLSGISGRSPLILELGCGSRKRIDGAIGIDRIDDDCVDIVGDVHAILERIPDGVVDRVCSHHFMEHVPDLEPLVEEIARVMRIGGQFEVTVPHFSNPYFYSDFLHRSHFGLYTFSYVSLDSLFTRRVPMYKRRIHFRLSDVALTFKSPPPFFLRYGLKRLAGFVFNCCRYMQEFYEENLCYLIPCYEIRYDLKRIETAGGP